VEAVRDHKNELALVILDLTMPAMGGEDALKLIKTGAPDLKVILSSGYDASQAIGRFGENAFVGLIHKPSTINDFLDREDRARQLIIFKRCRCWSPNQQDSGASCG
jgi:CheY-like chemotaxis protein